MSKRRNVKYLVSIKDADDKEICKLMSTNLNYAIKKFRELMRLCHLEDNVQVNAQWITTNEGHRITTIKELKKGDYFCTIRDGKLSKTVYVRDEYDKSSERYVALKFHDICSTRCFHSEQLVTDEMTF